MTLLARARIPALLLLLSSTTPTLSCGEEHYGFPSEREQREKDALACVPRTDLQGEAAQLLDRAEEQLHQIQRDRKAGAPGPCPGAHRDIQDAQSLRSGIPEEDFCIFRITELEEQVEKTCP